MNSGSEATQTIVGWIHGGKPRWGVVTDEQDDRLRIRSEGRDVSLRTRDIAVRFDGTWTEVAAAETHAAELAPETLWHRLADTVTGEFDVARVHATVPEIAPATLWLRLWQAPEYFARIGRARFRLRAADEIAHAKQEYARKRRLQQALAQTSADAERLARGELELASWAQHADAVRQVLAVLAYGDAPPEPLPPELFGLIRRTVEQHHVQQAVRWPFSWFAAQALGERDPWAAGHPRLAQHRQRLRAWRTPSTAAAPIGDTSIATSDLWAIDDAGTTDRDDAIGITADGDATVVEIAIADVTTGFGADDAVLADLAEQGTSVYLPTETIPLVPAATGIRPHSLDPQTRRAVMLLRARFDAEGKLTAPPALLRGEAAIAAATDYDTIDAGQQPPAWSQLAGLAEHLFRARLAHGAARIEQPEASVAVERMLPTRLICREPWKGARFVVREWMIFANSVFADKLAAAGLEAPYRTDINAAGRGPAGIRWQPQPNRQLGADAYVYATSPIRRVQDILAQRQLASLHGAPPLPRKSLRKLAAAAEQSLQEMKQWMHNANRYWKLRYLEMFPDTMLTATVLENVGRGPVRIRLHPLEFNHTVGTPPPHDTQCLHVTHVDAERGQLTVQWVQQGTR